ncbi:MAG TPA: DUF2490 domain-containing protein [Nevskiaceae bacterium]|nr:DUF2490 domain-containing protein [Nevskiaceae bacterium]
MTPAPSVSRPARSWRRHAAALLLGLLPLPLSAADLDQQLGWLAWFNSTPVAEGWSLISDVQLRSADDLDHLRNLLVRGGLSRSLGQGWSLGGGYAYIGTYSPSAASLTEHRSWQQLLLQRPWGSAQTTQRLRLEQRFIGRAGRSDLYADRLRYFLRLQQPVAGGSLGEGGVGPYLALQNELFLQLSARDSLNGQVFDQNRAYLAAGLRLNRRVDLELGYLNQYLAGRTVDTDNHVIQLALYTRLP